MTNDMLVNVLLWKYPGAKFIAENGVIVRWDSVDIDCPDEINIEADRQAYIAYQASILYQSKRKAEYPQMADYLDAKVKQGSADPTVQADGVAQEKTYIAACLAVKAKYQKPS